MSTNLSPNDYPDDVELGLEPDDPEPVTEPCGCAIYPGEDHDVNDCLEAQADALAEAEAERRNRFVWHPGDIEPKKAP